MALTACSTLLCGRGIVRHSVAKTLPAATRCRGTVHVRSAAAVAPSTKVRYAKRADKKDLFYYTTPPEDQDKFTNLEPEDVAVELRDLRSNNEMQWQRNGFELVQFPHAQNISWEDREQVKQVYYPEVEALLKQKTGASRVRVLLHGFRRGKTPKGDLDMTKPPGFQDVSVLTHVDFTDSSGPKTMRAFMGDEAEELDGKPWAIIQVWQPTAAPVQDSPLGMVDAATVSKSDLVPVALTFPGGYTHEVNFVASNPDHRWFWTSQMTTDEAYVFVNYDSRDDGRPRYTPHAAIADTSIAADVPIRESIETRALVFWD